MFICLEQMNYLDGGFNFFWSFSGPFLVLFWFFSGLSFSLVVFMRLMMAVMLMTRPFYSARLLCTVSLLLYTQRPVRSG